MQLLTKMGPSMLTKMVKTPTYTQKQPQQQKQDVALKTLRLHVF
jgi:hypothetical protein